MTTTIPDTQLPDPPDALRAQLRELLAGYRDALDDHAPRRFAWRRALTRRFLTGRIRRSLDELELTLHADRALGVDPSRCELLLGDLEHFRGALRPPLSPFQRTLIAVAILLVAQLLGRAPLIPIVNGPRRTPATGSLNEALDLNPGHVAKTIADLAGSPVATTLGAIFTLAAAAVLVLAIPAWGFRRARLAFGDPMYRPLFRSRRLHLFGRGSRPPAAHPLPGLEERTFTALRARRPAVPPYDLAVLGSVAVGLVTLGASWYVAFLAGQLRSTSLFEDRQRALHEAYVRTIHPQALGFWGILMIMGGLLIGRLLLRAIWPSRPPRPMPLRQMRSSYGLRHAVREGGVLVLSAFVGVLAAAGLSYAIYYPVGHQYRDPYLLVRLTDAAAGELERQPVVAFDMNCRPAPCSIADASLRVFDPGGFGTLGGETVLPIKHDGTLPLLQTVSVKDTVGGRPWREPPRAPLGPAFTVKSSELVQIGAIDTRAMLAAQSAFFRLRGSRVLPYSVGAGDYAAALFVLRGRRRRVFTEIDTRPRPGYTYYAVVLTPRDVARLRASRRRAFARADAILALTIRMHDGERRAVRLPLTVREI